MLLSKSCAESRMSGDERRSETDFPTREEFITIAPAVVETKARYGLDWFEGRWSALQLTLF